METNLYSISNEECEQSTGYVQDVFLCSYDGMITDDMICAKGNGDSCQVRD